MSLIKSIIESHLVLTPPNPKGWRAIACKVCNDHTRKGKRAAFIFVGNNCSYNCFNCGISANYDPSSNDNLSDNFIKVLKAFNIPDFEWGKLSLELLSNEKVDNNKTVSLSEPPKIQPLPFFYPLTDDINDDWCQFSIEYLTSRKVNWKDHHFYCVKKTDHPDNKRWYGRLIIPIFKDGNMIFYQGRDLTDLHTAKYLSASTPRDNVLYGFDQLKLRTDDPLYIMEGWFDAKSINGVAIFGNKLTKQQIMWLNTSSRPKVVIPDRFGDGHILAEQAIKLNWKVSTLDLNDTCKDVSESISTRGLLYTIKTIVDNTVEGNQATVITNRYCKRNNKNNGKY
ncbi:MAG: hypothetical protein ACXWFB_04775 [Nitrososphaeraceae archaeon]